MIEENGKRYATFLNAVVKKNKIFFVDVSTNVLSWHDLENNTDGIICYFNAEYGDLFSKLLFYDDEIIAVPKRANTIYRIDINDGIKQIISIDYFTDINDKQCKFTNGYIVNDELWLVGGTQPIIARLNLVNNEIIYYDMWKNELEENNFSKDDFWFIESVLINDVLSIACSKGGIILSFNVNTESYVVKKTGLKTGFAGIDYLNDVFYLTSRYGAEIYMVSEKGEIKIEDENNALAAPNDRTGYSVLVNNDEIYLIPWMGNSIAYIDKGIKGIEYNELWEESSNCMASFIYDGNLYIQSLIDGYIYEIQEQRIIRKFRIAISRKYHSRGYWILNNEFFNDRISLHEDYSGELEDYIKRI